MNKQRGITLIALIITIIVMLILVAVTVRIAVNSGLFGHSRNAVEQWGQAEREEGNIGNDNQIEDLVNEYKQGGKSETTEPEKITYTITKNAAEGISFSNSAATIEEGEEYISNIATLNDITILESLTVTMDGNQIITEGENIVDKDTKTIKIAKVTGNIEITAVTKKTNYLVDSVEVGEYIDIGIPYESLGTFYPCEDIVATSALTGWRVLRKNGSGETGTVTLVSAACPLRYYAENNSSATSIPQLANLYTTIQIVTSGTGFKVNGLGDNNLQNVFTRDKYIDTSKGVHALGCGTYYNTTSGTQATGYSPINEIEELYKTITGQTKTMTELKDSYKFSTPRVKQEAGANWKESYTDLMAVGTQYYLGGATGTVNNLWTIGYGGGIWETSYGKDYSVRVVVNLQSGVRLKGSNTGNGLTSDSAYSIAK